MHTVRAPLGTWEAAAAAPARAAAGRDERGFAHGMDIGLHLAKSSPFSYAGNIISTVVSARREAPAGAARTSDYFRIARLARWSTGPRGLERDAY